VERQADSSASNHKTIGNTEFPYFHGEQLPYPHSHGISSVLDVSQHGCDGHNGECDPEQYIEALEISIITGGVEMRNPGGVFNRREESPPMLRPDLFPHRGDRMNRGRSIRRNRSGSSTE